jgi:DNA-binding transcriptional MocR family regulator
MTALADLPLTRLEALEADLADAHRRSCEQGRRLDLTRGKPAPDQLDLSAPMDGILGGDHRAADGSDVRNYGQIRGLAEARDLGAELLEVPAAQVICWGNSSLTLMHLLLDTAMRGGLWGDQRRWSRSARPRMLAPVPGYDRHFALAESLGIGLVPVPMTDAGPDPDAVTRLAAENDDIKGIWCVPRYANPTGCTYGPDVVAALAELPGRAAADDFLLMWDNAYAVHHLTLPPEPLAPVMALAAAAGTADHVAVFGSTSKITYAGGGLGFMAASPRVLDTVAARLASFSIGPDKVNQLRHARFLRGRLAEHMAAHAALLRPKFALVEQALRDGLGGLDIARWTTPRGGYFVSLDTRPGLARETARLASQAGLDLTPPGSTFPGGHDPEDRNLRIAPTFAGLNDLAAAMEILVLCVKLASIRAEIEQRKELQTK